ncbi:hypothetical protein IAU60_003945 [Kwoniella sp. DSM 27419]
MSDGTKYGNAVDFNVDLHSIYAAYLGLFESSNTDWWDKSWGNYFATFNDFLGFGWEVMVIVDSGTGKPYIAVRKDQIAMFAKMIRTRFGESLLKDPPTTLPLNPVPTRNLSLRRLVTVHDLASYRKLSQTLPAAELSYLRSRVRAGEVGVVEQLFYAGGSSGERDTGGVGVRDNGVGYTWACVKTTWWDRGGPPHGLVPGAGRTQAAKGGKGLVLEVGVATLRCANLRAVDVWPPVPAENYRKSHLIVEEWVDKRTNGNPPNHPRAYGFGNSRFVAEKDVERILDANLAALTSQDHDAAPNTLILVTVGDAPLLPIPASTAFPSNVLHVDVLSLEFNLLRRAQTQGLPGTPDRDYPLNSLAALLQTLQIPVPPFAPLGNAGNDAYYTLLAFQKLMMGETRLPDSLFRQPDPYLSVMGYPTYAPFSTSRSMQFSNYGMLPPPPPMPAVSHGRRDSGGSISREFPPTAFAPPIQTGTTHVRRTSELPRPRPASMGESMTIPPGRTDSPPDDPLQAASAPSTVRPERKHIVRSQTVFWDDQAYAGNTPPDQERHHRNTGASRAPLRPNLTGGSVVSDKRGRSTGALPPSALRSGMTTSATGRSISWESGGVDGTNGIHHSGRPSRSQIEAHNGTGLRPSGSSSASLVKENGTGSIGTDSSTKLSSSSSGNVKSKTRLAQDQEASTAKPGKDVSVNGKHRLKSEKSVKDIAGALARFWVG